MPYKEVFFSEAAAARFQERTALLNISAGFFPAFRTCKDFFIKLSHWEFWDFYLVYAPVFVLHLWESIRSRSFFFFSAANPGLENSGFFGERKSEIMKKIPADLQPSWFLAGNESAYEVLNKIRSSGFGFPLICKPNVGERGKGVEKVNNEEDLIRYHEGTSVPYLVQEFVSLPLEFGVFFYRIPGERKGRVSSLTGKSFLSITGDGIRPFFELIDALPRARFVKPFLKKKFRSVWNTVPAKGKIIVLEEIGNHCRGTCFLDAGNLITDKLEDTFNRISNQIEGFYFGRFDVRVASIQDLEAGKIQILELNGAGAEPSHIYQPGFSFLKAQQVLWKHWKVLSKISRLNHSDGTPYWNFQQAISIRKKHIKDLAAIQTKRIPAGNLSTEKAAC
jgi:hypothetical protein